MNKLALRGGQRWIAVALAIAISILLAACGGSSGSSPVQPTAPPTTQALCTGSPSGITQAPLAVPTNKISIATGDIFTQNASTAPVVNAVNELGAPSVRIDLKMNNVWPTQSSHCNWSMYKGIAASFASRHVALQIVLDSVSPWAVPESCQEHFWTCAPRAPPGPNTPVAQFCAGFAQTFAHTNVAWAEFMNEASAMQGYWNNPKNYVKDYLSCYKEIKRYAPGIKVEPGGTAAVGTTGDGQTSAIDWYTGLCANGLGDNLDAGAVHSYSWPESPDQVALHEADSPWGQIPVVARILHTQCRANVRVNLTEEGYPTGGTKHLAIGKSPGYSANAVSEDTEAYEAETTIRLWQQLVRQRVAGFMDWYSLQDTGASDVEGHFGLLRQNGSKKPAWRVVRRFNRTGQLLPAYSGG